MLPITLSAQSKVDTFYVNSIKGKSAPGATPYIRLWDTTRVYKTLQSPMFQSGFTGTGWRIDDSARAAFQDLTIRGRLRVYELLASQIHALPGSFIVSSVGKVDKVADYLDGTYRIQTDSGVAHGFLVGDIIRAKRTNLADNYDSWMQVTTVFNDNRFHATLLDGEPPKAGYDYVRMGSVSDVNRQGIIYMTSVDDNAPYIDIKDGVTSKALFNDATTLKARLGNLSGIADTSFPSIGGYGAYMPNAFIKGKIVMAKGSSIDGTIVFKTINGTGDSTTINGNKITTKTIELNKIKGVNIDTTWFAWKDSTIYRDSVRIYQLGQQVQILTSAIMDTSGIDSLWGITTAMINQESYWRHYYDSVNTNTLQSNINLETSARVSGIGSVSAAISVESGIRTGADSVLTSSVTLRARKDSLINYINVSLEGIKIAANKITFDGPSIFKAINGTGDSTTINGGKITTGSITANKIYGDTLRGVVIAGNTSYLNKLIFQRDGYSMSMSSNDYGIAWRTPLGGSMFFGPIAEDTLAFDTNIGVDMSLRVTRDIYTRGKLVQTAIPNIADTVYYGQTNTQNTWIPDQTMRGSLRIDGNSETGGAMSVMNAYGYIGMGANNSTSNYIVAYTPSYSAFKPIDVLSPLVTIIGSLAVGGTAAIDTLTGTVVLSGTGTHLIKGSMAFATGKQIGSDSATPGVLGTGWLINQNLTIPTQSYMEIDNLRIRNNFNTHIFTKDVVRTITGATFITASAIVGRDDAQADDHLITIKAKSDLFAVGDLLEYQEGDGVLVQATVATVDTTTSTKYTKYTLTFTSGGYSNFTMGGTVTRVSGANILLSASGANSPIIDLYRNINGFGDMGSSSKIGVRIGKLDGMTFNGSTLPSNTYGIYTDNGFFNGQITATKGVIGGWILSETSLTKGTLTNVIGIRPSNTGTDKVFFTGASDTTGTGAVFYVRSDGMLYASNATISGNLTIGTGSSINFSNVTKAGTIPNSSIDSSSRWNNRTTKITDSGIYTDTVTANALKTNVIRALNSSTEGIRISANKIQIDGNTTFGTGYNPNDKIDGGSAAADVNANTTTINGGKITANTITTSQLNFTPATSSNVIATINASAEGIAISGAKITIDGTAQFASGYNPHSKVEQGGAAADINTWTTTIDGGKITTHSITVDQIATSGLTASAITTGTMIADRIGAGTISFGGGATVEMVYTGGVARYTVTADQINLASAENVTLTGHATLSSLGSPVLVGDIGGASVYKRSLEIGGTTIQILETH